jgi:putative SOS response-associated peptidase YedK
MCGRYVSPEQAAIERAWHIGGRSRIERKIVARTFNAAPTQVLPVVRVHPGRGMTIEAYRWGLIPSWARDPGIGAKLINARAESVAEKPSFRSAFRRRRCLVPMAGFYEWKKTATGKVPHYIHLMNTDIFGVAGLHEYWPGTEGAGPIETFTVITTEANEMVRKVYDRMPVILAQKDHAAWLDPANENTVALQKLLNPYPSDEMAAYPVSTRVNSTKNDDAELIDRVEDRGKRA